MRVLVKGAGWYGCHCALFLERHGIVADVCDSANAVFAGSSSKNQNRLHLGFHYPRSGKTRRECLEGFRRFLEKYGEFTRTVPKNYYLVEKGSMLDLQTYESIFLSEKIPFKKVETLDLEFDINESLIEGAIGVEERFIDYQKAAAHFKERIRLMRDYDETKISVREDGVFYGSERYDLLIDCTYSAFGEMFVEKCASLLYEYNGIDRFAITVVDGGFWSLYPYDIENNVYTLTDVELTPKGERFSRDEFEEKIKKYLPRFDEFFEYRGFFLSDKAKPSNVRTDDRSVAWRREGRTFSFTGGKITGIFAMEDILFEHVIRPRSERAS